MKQLLNKFRNAFAEPAEEEEAPQLRHRTTVLNEAIREGRKSRPLPAPKTEEKKSGDPGIAFVRERNEIVASKDPYNSCDYDRAKSWRNGNR